MCKEQQALKQLRKEPRGKMALLATHGAERRRDEYPDCVRLRGSFIRFRADIHLEGLSFGEAGALIVFLLANSPMSRWSALVSSVP